jgi:hypothetical protein
VTHHLRHDCAHACTECPQADPALCEEYAVMTRETVRTCKHCRERAWHDEHTFTDGEGNVFHTDVWACPRCGRVFGEEAA